MLSGMFESFGLQTCLVGLSVGLVVYYVFIRKRYNLPPGPWALPLIGNYKVYTATRIHREFQKLSSQYGPVIRIKIGPMTWIVLNDFESVMEAMVKKKADFATRPHLTSLDLATEGGKDIAFAQYSPTWQLHRKIANKALRYYLQGEHLQTLVSETMEQVMDEMDKEKGPFDPTIYMDHITHIMLFRMCYGRKCEINDPEMNRLKDLNKEVTDVFGVGLVEDLFPFIKDIYPTKKFQEVSRLMNEVFDLLRKLFHEHKDTFDPSNIRDFTDTLLLAKKEAEEEDDAVKSEQLSETHLVQTTSDIFFAGTDTSRMTLYWFVLFMAGHQDIQKKCHEELEAAVGKARTPTIADREHLQYIEACLYESMRLGSVAALGVPHATRCDTTVGGYDIPKGTVVLINHFALHRDPKYWKDVEEFRPERYLDDSGKIVGKPDSWLPFSAGKRTCLGESVAKPELALICASLLHRYNIKLPSDAPVSFEEQDIANLFIPKKYEIILERKYQ